MRDGILTHSSPIHGMGVFADQYWGPGWLIGVLSGRVPVEPDFHDQHCIWQEDSRGRHYPLLPDEPFKFLNHSDTPNAEVDGVSLYALETISPGEEITINYTAESPE